MKKAVSVIILLFGLTFIFSCNNKTVESPIPNIPFDITLDLNLILYWDLKNVMGGIVYINTGSKGVAILRIGQDQFAVFDRHCPYNVSEGCIVNEDPDNIAVLIDDQCCSSRFNLINAGLPDNGPAVVGLKSYRYNFNGSTLRIYN